MHNARVDLWHTARCIKPNAQYHFCNAMSNGRSDAWWAMRSRFSDFQKFCHFAAEGPSKGKSQEFSQAQLLRCDGRLTCNMHTSEPSCHAKVHACKCYVVFRCDKRQEWILCIVVVKATSRDRKIIFFAMHRVAEVILWIRLKSHCDSDYSSLSWWFGRELEMWARNDMHEKSYWEWLITLFYHSFSPVHFLSAFSVSWAFVNRAPPQNTINAWFLLSYFVAGTRRPSYLAQVDLCRQTREGTANRPLTKSIAPSTWRTYRPGSRHISSLHSRCTWIPCPGRRMISPWDRVVTLFHEHFESLCEDLKRYEADGRVLTGAMNYTNVIRPVLLPIPITNACIPALHLDFAPLLRVWLSTILG